MRPLEHRDPGPRLARVAAFVGRERERAKLAELVANGRVVTLTGSGGCGKTRLAAEIAREVASAFGKAAAEKAGYFEEARHYVPNMLRVFQQLMEYQGPMHDDPAVLAAISPPVLLLQGSATKPLFTASARHVVDHVPQTRMREIPGAGHAALMSHPEALAEAITEFFAPARQPA